MEGIKKLVSSFAEWQQCVLPDEKKTPSGINNHRSVAGALNAGGTKLWNSASYISNAMLAGRFLEMLLEESDSIRSGNSICHIFAQDDFRNIQHHPKIFGFPLSKYSCPRESELVVSLAKGLLSQTVGSFGSLGEEIDARDSALQAKVCVLCSTILPT